MRPADALRHVQWAFDSYVLSEKRLARAVITRRGWALAGSAGAARLKETRLGHGRVAGCRPDFCVLLLGIRGLTFARTTSDATWHAWLPHNNLAPPLYGGRTEPCYPASLSNGADFTPGFGRREHRGGRDRDRGDSPP